MDQRLWEQVSKGLAARFGGQWRVIQDDSGAQTIEAPDGWLSDPKLRAMIQEMVKIVFDTISSEGPMEVDVSDWLKKALSSGLVEWTVATSWVKRHQLDQPLALFWIRCDVPIRGKILRPLLKSYFEQERMVQMIALDDYEWLIFLALNRSTKVSEQQTQTLAHAEGLHELILVELSMDVQVLAERPRRWFRGLAEDVNLDAAPLLQMIYQLRQIGKWALEWTPEHPVNGLWAYRMEQMIMMASNAQRNQWISMLGGWARWQACFAEEPELERTLLAWIQSDAVISEASKMLFVHRNTLLYRLDKIDQELGYNPRKINDLILLRIGYSLYKMHKKT